MARCGAGDGGGARDPDARDAGRPLFRAALWFPRCVSRDPRGCASGAPLVGGGGRAGRPRRGAGAADALDRCGPRRRHRAVSARASQGLMARPRPRRGPHHPRRRRMGAVGVAAPPADRSRHGLELRQLRGGRTPGGVRGDVVWAAARPAAPRRPAVELAPAAPPVPALRGTERGGVTVGSRARGATLCHRLEPRALPRDPGRVAVRERPVLMDHAPLDPPHRSQRRARAVATPAAACAPHAPRGRAHDRVDAGRSARVRRTLVGHDGSRDLRQLHGAAALGEVASRQRGARDRRRSISVALHRSHLRAVLRLRVSGVGAHDPGSPRASCLPRPPARDAYPARRRGEWVG